MNALARLVAAVLVLLACQVVLAREVFECRAGPHRSFQDVPCADGDTVLHRLPDHPADDPRAQAARLARDLAQRNADALRQAMRIEQASRARLPESLGGDPVRATHSNVERASRKPRVQSPCERSRERRERAYAERGNLMGFDERRRLQDAMDAACGR